MDFDTFWKAYPHPKNRGSKDKAMRLLSALTLGDMIEVERAIPGYKAHLDASDWQVPMQAQRFLNRKDRNWRAFIGNTVGEDMAEIQSGHEEIKERNRQRDAAAYKRWQDRYEKQFGWRPG